MAKIGKLNVEVGASTGGLRRDLGGADMSKVESLLTDIRGALKGGVVGRLA